MAKRLNWNLIISSIMNFLVFLGAFLAFNNQYTTVEITLTFLLGYIILKMSLAFVLDFFYYADFVRDEVKSHFVEMVMMLIFSFI